MDAKYRENFEEGQDVIMVLKCFPTKGLKWTSLMGGRWTLCVSGYDILRTEHHPCNSPTANAWLQSNHEKRSDKYKMRNNLFSKGESIPQNCQYHQKTKKGWGNISRLKEAKEIWQLNSIPKLCTEEGKHATRDIIKNIDKTRMWKVQ